MPQTVLPLTPSPGSPNDISASKAQSGKAGDTGARFDEVSRAEQKKLDAKAKERQEKAESADRAKAERPNHDEAKSAEKSADNDAVTPEEAAQEKAEKAEAGSGAGDASESGSGQEEASTATESDSLEDVVAPVTFIDLQSLVTAAGQRADAQTAAGSKPSLVAVAGSSVPADQLVMANGSPAGSSVGGVKNGQMSGVTAGLQLADALNGEGYRSSDTAGAPRFQAALELASQLQSSPATRMASDVSANPAAKLAAEGMIPLKSYATSIEVPVGHAEWGDKLVGKLSWLTARNMSVAEIHLTPADLGPMEVKVRVQNEQANITVHAANPVVRDQLELHSHRLRDMLGEQGLNLARFDVSDSPQQQAGEQGAGADADGGSGQQGDQLSAMEADEELASGALDLSWNGEIDVFA